MTDRKAAWDQLHAVTPPGWFEWHRARFLKLAVMCSALLALSAVTSGCMGPRRGHPEPNPVRGYEIEISPGSAPFEPLNIGAQGEGCEVLLPDSDAYRTCLIATNVHPGVIGSDDDVITRPAIDALIWKARADGDVSVCQRSGRLSDAFVEECERAATAADYQYEGDTVRIRVPMGGAEPNPTYSTVEARRDQHRP